jgi:hypothetical protein
MKLISTIIYSKRVSFLILFTFLQLPSLRVIYKLSPANYIITIPIFLVLACTYYHFILTSNYKLYLKASKSLVITLLILALIAIVNYYVYPIIDARKNFMRGSDQDDAIIAVANALISEISPYAVNTYLNPGAAVGPGLMLLLLPFIFVKAYFLVTPAFVGLLIYFIFRATKSIKTINLFLLLLISSPAFWELMTNGSDLIVFGILCILPSLKWHKNLPIASKLFILIVLAMTLTSRVIFIYLAPLFGLLFCARKISLWLKYTIIITLMTLSIHLVFYSIDPLRYTPLLLIGKGLNLLSIKTVVVFTVLFVIGLFCTIHFSKNKNNHFLLLWIWTAFPLLFVTIISFNYNYMILYQYPVSYFAPQLPMIITYFVMQKTIKS